MIVFPNAKINLGLSVISKRSDGYHDLETLMYPVPLLDALEIIPIKGKEPEFSSSGIPIPGNSNDNLCLKAWRLMSVRYGISPVSIHLHKNIPMGAGLGGGSSDAAFTIKLLNQIFELGLSIKLMEEIATELGSDCPFFIRNIPAMASGRGEILTSFELSLKGLWIMLLFTEIHVSTAQAYAKIVPSGINLNGEVLKQKPEEWKDSIMNDFEKSVFGEHKMLQNIKNELYHHGAVYAAMSGSGSAMFGLFRQKPKPFGLNTSNYAIFELA